MGNVVLCKNTESESYLSDLRCFSPLRLSCVHTVSFIQAALWECRTQAASEKILTKKINERISYS